MTSPQNSVKNFLQEKEERLKIQDQNKYCASR